MNRIHIRRAHLLGLDAPTKLDVRGLYRNGADEMSDEQFENERINRNDGDESVADDDPEIRS